MKVEILAVGTELLMGQIANTNAQYISNRLPQVGSGVYYHSVVGDNPERLEACLRLALQRSDAVIMTGGLGPTKDDLTKETVARVAGKSLVLHQPSLDKLHSFFQKSSRPMTENNLKQAYMPEGCIIVENNRGTAPGCIIEVEGKAVVLLPGPPSEMKPMFEDTVMPYFRKKSDTLLYSKFIRIFGIGESSMEDRLMDLIDNQVNPTIAPYAKEGEVTLRLTASCRTEQEGEELIAPVLGEIKNRLGSFVYSENGEDMDQVAAELLLSTGTTISFAESCTGGLLSARLTEMPGISQVFDRGIVTYSNRAKEENLGVKRETLEQFGAVSSQTAVEMAEGIRKTSGTGLGLAITGIAGPGGGTEEKPVGLVYVALADDEKTVCKELRLWGNRDRIRHVTCLHAFDMIRRKLQGLEQLQ